MARRLQFYFYLDRWCEQSRGLCSVFIDGKGRETTSWWSSPPPSIDHVDITYLQGRHPNVRTQRHVEFIKEQFKEDLKRFDEYKPSRFREKVAK